jgi:hypothetical protein
MARKSEMARRMKEVALAAGKTVVVATPQTVTKWSRHWRKGRYVDVAEDLKPMREKPLQVWYDQME